MQRSCTPETIMMRQTMEGHPDVGSPNTSVLMMIKMIRKKATPQNADPITEETTRGVVEKEKIPSIA